MNKYAKKLFADKLATGHNMDDEVQSFVMNIFNNDFERMKRMNPTSGIIDHEGFVKRIKPLYETPEKEIIACANKALAKGNYPALSEEKIEKLRALHAKDVIIDHLNIKWYSLYKWLQIPGLLEEGRRLLAEKRDDILPYGGMREIINKLAEKKEIIVVSSNKKETIEYALKKHEIKYHEIHHCVKLFGKGIELNRIIKEKGLEKDRDKIIYVGDEVRDAYACYFARIGMLAVMWGLNNAEAFRNIGFPKEYMVNTPAEMDKRLREL